VKAERYSCQPAIIVEALKRTEFSSRNQSSGIILSLSTTGRPTLSGGGVSDFIWDPTISAECFRHYRGWLLSLDTSAFSTLEVFNDNRAI